MVMDLIAQEIDTPNSDSSSEGKNKDYNMLTNEKNSKLTKKNKKQ